MQSRPQRLQFPITSGPSYSCFGRLITLSITTLVSQLLFRSQALKETKNYYTIPPIPRSIIERALAECCCFGATFAIKCSDILAKEENHGWQQYEKKSAEDWYKGDWMALYTKLITSDLAVFALQRLNSQGIRVRGGEEEERTLNER